MNQQKDHRRTAALAALALTSGTAAVLFTSGPAGAAPSQAASKGDVDRAGIAMTRLGENKYSDVFADVVVDEADGRVRLDIVSEGAASDDLKRAAHGVPVDVQVVPRSRDTLQATMKAIVADLDYWKSRGVTLNDFGPNESLNTITVGIDDPDSPVAQDIARRYGPNNVEVVHGTPGVSLTTRFADSSPYNGGLDLTTCSAGYGAHVGSSPAATSSRMIVAGHCFANGQAVYHHGVLVGTAVRSGSIYYNGGTDYESVSMTSSKYIWETDTLRATSDGSVTSVPTGVTVCKSGKETNKTCGTTSIAVIGTDHCVYSASENMNFCHQDEADSSSNLAAHGDSGSPWFTTTSSGGTDYYSAVGITSQGLDGGTACTTHSGANTCFKKVSFTEAWDLWAAYSLWPNY
jgi:hypothetical protein